MEPPSLLQPPEDGGPCRGPEGLSSVLARTGSSLLRLPLLVDLVEDGESGQSSGGQLRTGPAASELPPAGAGVSELEPGRGGVAGRGRSRRPRRALPLTARRTGAGALSRPPERVLPGESRPDLTRRGEGSRSWDS